MTGPAGGRGVGVWLRPALVVSVAAAVGAVVVSLTARSSVPGIPAAALAASAAAVVTSRFRGPSIRMAAYLLVGTTGALFVRFGRLSGSLAGGDQQVLLWVVAVVATLVLCDRVATGAQPAVGPDPSRAGGAEPPAEPDARRTARAVVLTAAAVVAFAVVAVPLALPHLTGSSRPGDAPSLGAVEGGGVDLRSTSALDMTTRPELSDEVVFTVRSDRATFWRGETFDAWDGRRWTRTDEERAFLPAGVVTPGPDDLGALGPVEFTQQIQVEAPYADLFFAAPSAVRIRTDGPAVARSDGGFLAGSPMGRGATYTVVSRTPVLDESSLRAARGPVPARIAEQYASDPPATDRVRAAAREVTAGFDNDYDRIRALEAWMGARAEYSLDAPLSPEGVDVVDHFLFESRQGWCEQVASSLVVLARVNGIPARLATGFVPGDRDPVTGRWLVRAREAHAWAEVWFPELGWVPFDPTANVPLAGAADTDDSWGRWLLDHAVIVLLTLAAVAVVGAGLLRLLRRIRERRRSRPTSWVGVAQARLESLGERSGRTRRPDETAARFAAALAAHLDDERVHEVGVAIDRSLYARVPPDADEQRRVDVLLDEVTEAVVAEGRSRSGRRPVGASR